MQIYHKIWQRYHNACLLPGIEIHHIDGNHANNDPLNLLAVTIDEHLIIHRNQKDWGAVQSILMRMELTEEVRAEIRLMASLHQKELLKTGRHNWQQLSAEERTKISSDVGCYTRDNKLGIHAINADPVLSQQNSSNAGSISYKKKAGFHAKPYQSISVGGSSWWQNTTTGKRKRCKASPGKGWTQTMGKINKSKSSKTVKGIPWWNDGNGNKVRAELPPDNNWKRGMK